MLLVHIYSLLYLDLNEQVGFMFKPLKSVFIKEVLNKLSVQNQKNSIENSNISLCLALLVIKNICCFNDAAVKNKIKVEKCIAMTNSFRKICLGTDVLEDVLLLLCDVVAKKSPTQYMNR